MKFGERFYFWMETRPIAHIMPLYNNFVSATKSVDCNMATNSTIKMTNLDKKGHGADGSSSTVSFLDARGGNLAEMGIGRDITVDQGNYDNAEIGEFLRRPVKLFETTWAVGALLNDTGRSIWHLWADNEFVKRKLDNFYMLRGKLMVKIVLNGTNFHYGKIVASYRPLPAFSDLVVPTYATRDRQFLSAMSQATTRLHIILDPSTDSGGCLCLPFFWRSNYLVIPTLDQFADMGDLDIQSLAPLRVATSSVDAVDVTVFAWMEDIELKIPTNFSNFSAEMGVDEYEEQKSGVISGPASAVASAAGLLSNVPMIAPFARATELAATAVGSIAKIFGYARPVNVENISNMRQEPLGTLAVTSGADNVMKLALDPKQETTIDPRTVGLDGCDEMALDYIVKKECLINQFEWTPTDAVGTELFWSGVTPEILIPDDALGTAVTTVQMTPACFASKPFQYWSGTMIIRFEIMASRFHRGRLKLAWDPWPKAGAASADNFNTNYVKVIDLEECRNVEFAIPWGVDVPYRAIGLGDTVMGMSDGLPIAGSPVPTVPAIDFVNGWVSLSILNTLVAPDVTSDITVNVYMRAGDDFEIMAPYDANFANYTYFYKQSGEGSANDVDEENSAACAPVTEDITGPSSLEVTDPKALVFFGERIKSFRSLVMRYNFQGSYCWPKDLVTFPGTSGAMRFTMVLPNFPQYQGFDPDGYWTADAPVTPAVPYNPYMVTLLNYLTPAYVGWRGGMRSKYVISNMTSTLSASSAFAKNTTWWIFRQPDDAVTYGPTMGVLNGGGISNASNPTSWAFQNEGSLFQGTHAVTQEEQPVMAAEFPFYSEYRFALAQSLSTGDGTAEDSSDTFKHEIKTDFPYWGSSDDIARLTIQRFTSVGDDFSLFYFQNVPQAFVYATPRAALNGHR